MFVILLVGKYMFKKDVCKLIILCFKCRGNFLFYFIEVYFIIKWKLVFIVKFNELILV